VHTSPRTRAAARAASCLLAALAAAVAMLPGPPASADDDPRTVPKLLDVPPDHPWRKDTRLALSIAKALPGDNAAEARRKAIHNLIASSPPELRRHIEVGPLHGRRFTFTIVGDQACAAWPRGGGSHRAFPGPCVPRDRVTLRNPLRATATVVGFLYDDTLGEASTHRQRVSLMGQLFTRPSLANLTWTYAPRGVGVSGLIDDDNDGLDDDARVTLHADSRARCLRLGVYPGQHSTSSWGECRNLEPRVIHYPRRIRH
jgi:hypothetical protein